MRKFCYFIFVFILFQLNAKAGQRKYERMWQGISISTEKAIASDTMLVLYTTRYMQVNNKIVFNDEIDLKNAPKVVLAICRNLTWKLHIMESINDAMLLMPVKKDLVVYVEGVGKSFPLAMYRCAGITTQYQVNVIMFDYPTLKESFTITRSYYFALGNVKKATVLFGNFLQELQLYQDSGAIWIKDKNRVLFIHSMGNRLLKETITNNEMPHLDSLFFSRVILNAPCVNQAGHSKWVDSCFFAKEVYINYNRKDLKLLGAMILSHRLLLGSYIHEPHSSRAVYINMEEVLNSSHNGFIFNPGRTTIPISSQKYFSKLFHGEDIEIDNYNFFKQPGSKKYYVLK